MVDEKSFRTIVFTGKDTDWRTWKLRFLAKAAHKDYRELLMGKRKPAVPDENEVWDENEADEKKLLNSCALNVQAYSALCISCEGSAFGIVKRAATPRPPNGDVALAWKSLCEKYKPTTQMSLVILKK
jgi:hypothetical protein